MELTDKAHWDSRSVGVRARPPSMMDVGCRDIVRILERHVHPGDRVIEIGCAPGKFLLWCAMIGRAKVAGVEYAPKSWEETLKLFAAAGQTVDLRLEDIFQTTFGEEFNVVYSTGLIEHFVGDQLKSLVRKHLDLVVPGGTAVIIIPNYSGIYGWVLSRLNRPNYETHSIELMSVGSLLNAAPVGVDARAYRSGSFNPWVTSFGIPRNIVARLFMYGLNVMGLLQPFKINALCPWLVLEMQKPLLGPSPKQ